MDLDPSSQVFLRHTNLELPVHDVHGMSRQPKYEIFLSRKYLDPYRLSGLRLNGKNMKNQTYLHTMYKLNIAAWMILESLLLSGAPNEKTLAKYL